MLDGVRKFLEDHAVTGKTGARDFYEFETELHARLMEAEREIVGRVMSASDVDADALEIDGKTHRRVLRSSQTYLTAAGPVVWSAGCTRIARPRPRTRSRRST